MSDDLLPKISSLMTGVILTTQGKVLMGLI